MDDAAFKKLFSDPRMIELLIRRHVPEVPSEFRSRMPGRKSTTTPSRR